MSDRQRLLEYLIEHGRQQERERIKGLVSTRAHQARANYKADPCEYHRAQEDAWNDLLAALDKEVDG